MSTTRIQNVPVVDYSWQARAACIVANGELFLGPDEERTRDRIRRQSLALRVCGGCPVREACLAHALGVPERYGVWGGTTPEQRLLLMASSGVADAGVPDLA